MVHINFNTLSHAGIRDLKPYVPGKSAEEVAKEYGLKDVIKLASNENAWGCSPAVHAALNKMSKQTLASYPQSYVHPFRQQLANYLKVDADMITFSNGSDLLVGLLISCFAIHQSKHVMTHRYAFVTYEVQAQTLGVPIVVTPTKNWQVDIDAMIETCNEDTALIFIANPNNPTGILVEQNEIIRLLDNIPKTTILVLDEAYCEYAFDNPNHSLSLLEKYPNLVLLRTFSKVYGLAGLRLGYSVSHPDISKLLYRIQLPFTVNIAALIAGEAALDDQAFVKKTIELTTQGLRFLEKAFHALQIEYLPSHANFITIDCKKDAYQLFQRFQEYGIVLRPLNPYEMNQYMRITVGTDEQNKRLIDVCQKLLIS